MFAKYRIVTDRYAGFEVQVRYWWFPVWIQSPINTHPSLEDAKQFINKLKTGREVYRE